MTKTEKMDIIKKFGQNEKDTGNTSVQVAILTYEIEQLKLHFEKNPKDLHSKRGFLNKINQRKKLLNYLKNNDFLKYKNTIQELDLRK